MSLTLYAHPFSSYSQKVLVALYENATAFDYRSLQDPAANEALAALWPRRSFPVLVDAPSEGEARTVIEATSIIEHLAVHHSGRASLIPAEPAAAVEVRMLDRIFDNHVMAAVQAVVADALRPPERRDPLAVEETKHRLDLAYAWLDDWMTDRDWASGGAFSLSDCAAAPSLFYADWTHPIDPAFKALSAYRARLLKRPSFARAVDEARPFRSYFPLGAPDRD